MNLGHLHDVFRNYIDKFEELNREGGNHEVYKWYCAKSFRDTLNLDTPNETFADMLNKAKNVSKNLIDSGGRLPFAALCKAAKADPDTVRTIFRNLLEDDNNDLEKRQNKIDDFVTAANKICLKQNPGSFLNRSSQHTAMTLLWLYDPDNNYYYKYREATALAECLEFYDDWGSYSDFNLKIYHRFCDDILEQIKKDDNLLKTHMGRFEKDAHLMHPDKELHILLADIIFCFARYLKDGIDIKPMTSEERKNHFKNKEIAYRLLDEYNAAYNNLTELEDAITCFTELIHTGAPIRHKTFGTAELKELNNGFCTLYFSESAKTLKRPFLKTIGAGHLIIEAPEFDNLLSKYKTVLGKNEQSLRSQLEITRKRLEPYEKYID